MFLRSDGQAVSILHLGKALGAVDLADIVDGDRAFQRGHGEAEK